MAGDINIVRNLVNIEAKGLGGSLNPLKWFRRKYTEANVNILFIDDLDMPVFENLKKAGYRVRKIRDAKNIGDPEVKNAQIIFVDFDGVGKVISPIHQGAGLVKELKTECGDSKYIVLYTAQPTLPADTTMRSLFDAADARLRKDSDVMDFTEQIRIALSKLK